jgi:CheY-like chemotaxis protein
MIVDDDLDVRESLAEVLEDHGYPSIAAANGQEALERLRVTSDPPCLILLDLMMPVMDGRQFRAIQMQDARLGAIPVLILSAQNRTDDLSQDLLVTGYLRKPIDLPLLLKTLEDVCRTH